MMGMGAGPKKLASMIVARISPEYNDIEGMRAKNAQAFENRTSGITPEQQKELMIHSEEIMKSFETRDPEKFMVHMKMFLDCCDKYEEEAEGAEAGGMV